MPTVSIISAVYNAESTIRRCIDSILSQTFSDFELLLIDDGSTDGSARICDEYALADHRIKVVHKKNEGVASTRQRGMELARGEYMMHVDPDDWIEQETLENMLEAITSEKALIAICDYTLIGQDESEIIRQEPTMRTSDSMIDDILSGRLLGGVCNKLISRRLWGGVKFTSGIDYCEDVLFLAKICNNESFAISYVNKPLYNYDKSAGTSITSGKFTKQKFEAYRAFANEIKTVYPAITDAQYKNIIWELALKAFANNILSNREYYIYFHKERKHLKSVNCKGTLKSLIYLSSLGLYRLCWTFYRSYINLNR